MTVNAPELNKYLALIDDRDAIETIRAAFAAATPDQRGIRITAQAVVNVQGSDLSNQRLDDALSRVLTENAVGEVTAAISAIQADITAQQAAAQAEYDALFNPPP